MILQSKRNLAGGWNEYVEDYCFIQSTFVYPLDDPLPRPERRPVTKDVNYYQVSHYSALTA